jgi:uncharacterized protein
MRKHQGGFSLVTIKKESDTKIYIPNNIQALVSDRKLVYFDIETTGLNPKSSNIILIGMSYEENGRYIVEQFFAEDLDEEKDILLMFSERLKNFDMVVTYNGKSFDVPFTNLRMEKYNINYVINQEHLDIICHVRPNKAQLGLSSCSLKSVEKLFDIGREDTINGAESITLYFQYLKTRDEISKEKIMIHNFEDVYNLPYILKIFDHVEYKEHPNKITSKQRHFLKKLLEQRNFQLVKSMETLSKHEASKLIDFIINGTECEYEDYLKKI